MYVDFVPTTWRYKNCPKLQNSDNVIDNQIDYAKVLRDQAKRENYMTYTKYATYTTQVHIMHYMAYTKYATYTTHVHIMHRQACPKLQYSDNVIINHQIG